MYNPDCRNAEIAHEALEKMRVTKPCASGANVNDNYFKRTFTHQMQNIQALKKETRIGYQRSQKQIVSQKPNEWDAFLFQVRKYRRNELHKYIEDKKYFDKVLQRLNHVADGSKQLIDKLETKIIKDSDDTHMDTEKIIQVTQERSSEQIDQKYNAADKALEYQFQDLLNH